MKGLTFKDLQTQVTDPTLTSAPPTRFGEVGGYHYEIKYWLPQLVAAAVVGLVFAWLYLQPMKIMPRSPCYHCIGTYLHACQPSHVFRVIQTILFLRLFYIVLDYFRLFRAVLYDAAFLRLFYTVSDCCRLFHTIYFFK